MRRRYRSGEKRTIKDDSSFVQAFYRLSAKAGYWQQVMAPCPFKPFDLMREALGADLFRLLLTMTETLNDADLLTAVHYYPATSMYLRLPRGLVDPYGAGISNPILIGMKGSWKVGNDERHFPELRRWPDDTRLTQATRYQLVEWVRKRRVMAARAHALTSTIEKIGKYCTNWGQVQRLWPSFVKLADPQVEFGTRRAALPRDLVGTKGAENYGLPEDLKPEALAQHEELIAELAFLDYPNPIPAATVWIR